MAIFNANFKEQDWILPELPEKYSWNIILDSSSKFNETRLGSLRKIKVPAWSVLVFEIKK